MTSRRPPVLLALAIAVLLAASAFMWLPNPRFITPFKIVYGVALLLAFIDLFTWGTGRGRLLTVVAERIGRLIPRKKTDESRTR